MKIIAFRSSCAIVQTLERRPAQAFNLLGLDPGIAPVNDSASIAPRTITPTSRIIGALI